MVGALKQPLRVAALPTVGQFPDTSIAAFSGPVRSIATATGIPKHVKVERESEAGPHRIEMSRTRVTPTMPSRSPFTQSRNRSDPVSGTGAETSAQQGKNRLDSQDGSVEEETHNLSASHASLAETHQPQAVVSASPSPSHSLGPTFSEPASDEAVIMEILEIIVFEASRYVHAVVPQSGSFFAPSRSSTPPFNLRLRHFDHQSNAGLHQSQNADNTTMDVAAAGDKNGNNADGDADEDLIDAKATIDGADAGADIENDADAVADAYSEDEVMLLEEPQED